MYTHLGFQLKLKSFGSDILRYILLGWIKGVAGRQPKVLWG